MSELKLEYVIHDNVHGRIWLTALEREIINTPTFQRLRRISHLGLANYVFPCATHNRFSHSLGVLALMGRLIEQDSIEIREDDKQLLRMAALLHDVGHYPFSHLTESAYAKIDYLGKLKNGTIKQDDPRFVKYIPNNLFEKAAMKHQEIGEASHEKMAEEVIKNSQDIKGLLASASLDLDKLSELIQGKYVGKTTDELTTLYTNLLNSEFDVDRLDYLLRDSQFTGAPYGLIDLQYLIENMRLGFLKKGTENVKCLAIDKRHGMHALEHYLLSRYFMYSQIIYHKTIRALEILYQAIYFDLVDKKLVPSTYEEVKNLIKGQGYLNFDDASVITAMRKGAENDEELAKNVHRLLNRQPPKLVFEKRTLLKEKTTILDNQLRVPDHKEQLAKKAGVNCEDFVLDHIDMQFTRGSIPVGEQLQEGEIEKAAKLATDEGLVLLSRENTSLFSQLGGQKMMIDRIYYLPKTTTEELTKIKAAFLQALNDLRYN